MTAARAVVEVVPERIKLQHRGKAYVVVRNEIDVVRVEFVSSVLGTRNKTEHG